MSSCPRGTYRRRGYTRHDGSHTTRIMSTCAGYPIRNPWVEFLKDHGGQGYSREELQEMYHRLHR